MSVRVVALVLLVAAPPQGAPEAITVSSARGTLRVPIAAERGYPAVSSARMSSLLAWETMASPPGMAVLRVTGQSFAFVLDAGYFRHEGHVYTLAAGPYIGRDSRKLFKIYLPWIGRGAGHNYFWSFLFGAYFF